MYGLLYSTAAAAGAPSGNRAEKQCAGDKKGSNVLVLQYLGVGASFAPVSVSDVKGGE